MGHPWSFASRLHCGACQNDLRSQRMARVDDVDNIGKRQVSIRFDHGHFVRTILENLREHVLEIRQRNLPIVDRQGERVLSRIAELHVDRLRAGRWD